MIIKFFEQCYYNSHHLGGVRYTLHKMFDDFFPSYFNGNWRIKPNPYPVETDLDGNILDIDDLLGIVRTRLK